MARKFEELKAKMPPEARARLEAKTKQLLQEMALDELRAARELTQEHLARILGVNQSSISKIEKRTDMYLSTLRGFIQAMGGELEIRAVFPDGTVRIGELGKLD